MDDNQYYIKRKEKAKEIFFSQKSIYCPYFKTEVFLTSDGFHHLRFDSTRSERNKKEQILKFNLLPLGLEIIRKTGTVQEYRKRLEAIGKKSKDGFKKMKNVEYWGFIAIVGEKKIKVKVILRRIGDGNVVFWSVMPHPTFNKKQDQRLYSRGIEGD